jgi:hypothetical protein
MEELNINLVPLYEYYVANKETFITMSLELDIPLMEILLENYSMNN